MTAGLAFATLAFGGGFAGGLATAQPVLEVRGEFRLTAPDGRIVTKADLAGKVSLVFFGFMHCPDVCPTTLLEFAQLMKALGPKADRVNVVFISVDPERDKPGALGEFVGSFDKRILGLTGDRAAVDAAIESFHAVAEKRPQGDSYAMTHSTGVYTFDGAGKFLGFLPMEGGPKAAAEKLAPLLG